MGRVSQSVGGVTGNYVRLREVLGKDYGRIKGGLGRFREGLGKV